MQLLKELSFSHRACPREGVGRESILESAASPGFPYSRESFMTLTRHSKG